MRIKVLILSALLWIVRNTVRWVHDESSKLCQGEESYPRLCAIWHGDISYSLHLFDTMLRFNPDQQCSALVSLHRDGQLATDILLSAGIDIVRGSSSNGGAIGTLNLIKRIREHRGYGVITPDGPRGPNEDVKPGIVKIAQLIGAPLYPIAFGNEKYWQLKSWDKAKIPKPFSKAVCLVGDPIHVARDTSDADFDKILKEFEKNSRALSVKARGYFNA